VNRRTAVVLFAVVVSVLGASRTSWSQAPNLAPGFSGLPKGAKVVMMPADIEIYSISAGGVPEPRADWTEAGQRNFKTIVTRRQGTLGLSMTQLADKDADDFAEISALHTAIARAIAVHHFGPGSLNLPTKDGKLDWSLGDSTQALKKATGADYAVFSWVRDSHASAERQAAMVAIAVLSLGRAVPRGGRQTAYASLVELETGRILWFNRLSRESGNIKDEADAEETVESLFKAFPVVK
jgi:hypothetical protein